MFLGEKGRARAMTMSWNVDPAVGAHPGTQSAGGAGAGVQVSAGCPSSRGAVSCMWEWKPESARLPGPEGPSLREGPLTSDTDTGCGGFEPHSGLITF